MAVELARGVNRGKTCPVDGCDTPARKRGYCATHYNQWRRTGQEPTIKWRWATERGCIVCGAEAWAGKRRAFCSGACQQADMRARKQGGTVAQHFDCALCGVRVDLLAPGKSETPGAAPRKRRNDSTLCAVCVRQRKYRHKFSSRALAARDGILCGICDLPVDMDLPAKHPEGPSVDHVIARAQGGTDDPSNLQLAHLHCNQVKHTRSGWTLPARPVRR